METSNEKKLQRSLANLLNYIRMNHGDGTSGLPPEVLNLVDPAIIANTAAAGLGHSRDPAEPAYDADDLDFNPGSPVSLPEQEPEEVKVFVDPVSILPKRRKSKKPLKCAYCKTEHVSVVELSKHSLKHCNVVTRKLKLPKSSPSHSFRVLTVKERAQPNRKPGYRGTTFKCHICGVIVRQKEHLESHLKLMHFAKKSKPKSEPEVEVDSESTPVEPAAKRKVTKPKSPVKKFPCPNCTKMFSRSTDVWRHVNTIHVTDKKCPHCGVLKPRDEIRSHIEFVHLGKRFQCKFCNCEISRAEEIRLHLYYNHREVASSTSNSNAVNVIYVVPPDDEKLEDAETQGSTSETQATVSEQTEGNEPNTTEPKDKEKRTFQCQICLEEFETRHKYRTHILQEHTKNGDGKRERVRKCKICDEEFRNVYQYRLHLDTQHSGRPDGYPTTFKCDLCDKVFNRELNLLRHIRGIHPANPIVHLCSICGMTFRRKSGLESHDSRVHHRELKYKCKMCPALFGAVNDVKRHEDRHLGKNLKPCPYCGLSKPSNNLLSHIAYVHEGKRLKCKFCSILLHQMSQVRPHLLLKHLDIADKTSSKDAVDIVYVEPTHGIGRKGPSSTAALDESGPAIPVTTSRKSTPSYNCVLCHAVFHSKDSMEVHQIKHQRDPEYRLKPRRRVQRIGEEILDVTILVAETEVEPSSSYLGLEQEINDYVTVDPSHLEQ